MSHFALSTVKHNGQRYFRGDELPDLTKDQVAALGGVVSSEPPAQAEAKPEQTAPEPVKANEPEPDVTDDPEGAAISDPDTGEAEPVAEPPAEAEADEKPKSR